MVKKVVSNTISYDFEDTTDDEKEISTIISKIHLPDLTYEIQGL